MDKPNQTMLSFKTQREWGKGLSKNYTNTDGVWIKFYKKSSGLQTFKYDEALDEALCYGWIDGQTKSFDEKSYLLKFTPRRPRSLWSKRNTEHIARLTKDGRMKPSGIAEVERAKADGRWDKAYGGPATMAVPEDFIKALSKNKKALGFFKSLNKSNTYAIAWMLQEAKKSETRQRRFNKFLEMMKKGEKLA
jgi:uncharacterized protein YdeI (YjbR/CyaY-like superfamily)